ncbi:ribonuclease H-like domain-containing protein [Tanacetum coccineum]
MTSSNSNLRCAICVSLPRHVSYPTLKLSGWSGRTCKKPTTWSCLEVKAVISSIQNAFCNGSLLRLSNMHQLLFRDPRHPKHVCLYNDHFMAKQALGPGFSVLQSYAARWFSPHRSLLQRIIASLHAEFSMTDLGLLNYFLGVSVTRNTSGMFLSQQKYATEVLERAGMLTL